MTTAANPQSPSDRLTSLQIVAAIACALALAMDMVEMAIGNVLSTVFSAQSNPLHSGALSSVLASVYVGAVIGAPVFGWISDRRDIRVCLAISLIWLALMSCLAGASTTIWQLTAFRFLSGLSLGAIPPLLIAYLTRIAPAEKRGAFIFWVCGGAALIPPFALMLIRWVIREQPLGIEGWRWPLYAAGVVAFVMSLVFFYLPRSREVHNDVAGKAPERNVSDAATDPGRGRFGFIALIYFLLPWSSVGFPLLTGPILLRQGYDLNQALFYVALTTVGPSLGSFVTTSFVDRFDRRVILGGCSLLMLAAVAMFVVAHSANALAMALIIFGIAGAIYVTALTIYAAEIFPTQVRTFATSSAWAINRAAAAIVPIVLIPLVAAQSVFVSMLPICISLAATALLILARAPAGEARRVIS